MLSVFIFSFVTVNYNYLHTMRVFIDQINEILKWLSKCLTWRTIFSCKKYCDVLARWYLSKCN